jgi:hypothetical protein
MALEGLLCWSCGKPTGITGRVMRSDNCSSCLADMRCCRGCRHFDPTRRFHCREPIETNIVNKEKANFCDFFSQRDAMKTAGGVTRISDSKDDRKKRFDDLFKD